MARPGQDVDWPTLRYDPERSQVNEIARRLRELTGTDWTGWHLENSNVPGAALFATYRQDPSGRYVIGGLMLLAEDALTADQLRAVPVAAMENSVNLGAGDAYDRLRAELDALPPLRRTAEMPPEDFSRLVAEHFTVWARYTPHPAAAIAAEWKVKIPTVHTWVREARLRGFLPPARRGKGRAR